MTPYLNRYTLPGIRIERLTELNGVTYVLGWVYDFKAKLKNQLYLARLTSDGMIDWHNRYEMPAAVIGASPSKKFRFTSIHQVEGDKNSDLVLLIQDDEQVVVIRTKGDGSLVWRKKYYTKSDVPLYYGYLSFEAYLYQIEDRFILLIQDIHSVPGGGVKRMDYKLYSLDLDGEVIQSRIVVTKNPILDLRDHHVYREKGLLVLGGGYKGNAYICSFDLSLKLIYSYRFTYADEGQGYNYLEFYRLSQVYSGKMSALGSYTGENDTTYFIAEIDPNAIDKTRKIQLSDKHFVPTYQKIELLADGTLFHEGGDCYRLDSNYNLDWVKRIQLPSVNRSLIPNTFYSNKIYSVYTQSSNDGYYVIGKTDLDYSSCETEGLRENVNFKPANVRVIREDLKSKDLKPPQYKKPEIKVNSLKKLSLVDICKESGDTDPDVKRSAIRTLLDCITPANGMQNVIEVQLRDSNGDVVPHGGASVSIFSTIGVVSDVADHQNGTYTAFLTSDESGTAQITYKVNGENGGQSTSTEISKKCDAGVSSPIQSTIEGDNPCAEVKSGVGTGVSIRLRDQVGNPIYSSSEKITLHSNIGKLTSPRVNKDGVLRAQFTPSLPGKANIRFRINGKWAFDQAVIQVKNDGCGDGKADVKHSIITASPQCIHPDHEDQAVINVQLFDHFGYPVYNADNDVEINSTAGDIISFTNNGDGSYTALLISGEPGEAIVGFSLNGITSPSTVQVNFKKKCNNSAADLAESFIHANAPCIKPNGEDETLVTVVLVNQAGNPIYTGGDEVTIETTFGDLTPTVNQGDGSYTAVLRAEAEGVAVLTFLINGQQAEGFVQIALTSNCGASPEPKAGKISASTDCESPSNGNDPIALTVQLYDDSGNPISIGGNSVLIETDFGEISLTHDNNDGSYTALLWSTTEGNATVKFQVEGTYSPEILSISFSEDCGGDGGNETEVDLNASTIIAIPNAIHSDGQEISEVQVQLFDQQGNPLTEGNYTVQISLTGEGNIGPTSFDTDSGLYTANLTSTTEGLAHLSFSVDGTIAPSVYNVILIGVTDGDNDDGGDDSEGGDIAVGLHDEYWLQSPNFYLQAAGSRGNESTAGIHLRWMFRGILGEMHLPKRNYASTTYNFNKPNDYVRLYRAAYTPHPFTFTFLEGLSVVDDENHLWIYRLGNKEFYVHFYDTAGYDSVRNEINPFSDVQSFLHDYGDGVIEIENKQELFFRASLQIGSINQNSSLQAEGLSTGNNTLLANKYVSWRDIFTVSELNSIETVCENGRSIRFRASNCLVQSVKFEFYSDFLTAINNQNGWEIMDVFGLSLDEPLVFEQLEPIDGAVKNNWLRFNDDSYVNIDNYHERWSGGTEPQDRNIREIVQNYIQLSDAQNNPTAIESVPFNSTDNDTTDISLLDLLNLSARDYHIARMLGLGTLDIENGEIQQNKFIYLTEYVTYGDLQDGGGAREVQHLSMSLPTGKEDERLPLPFKLSELRPGVYYSYDGEPQALTDDDGYTYDGKKRFVSIFNEQLSPNIPNLPFFASYNTFMASQYSLPTYAGLEHKLEQDTNWQKPELSHAEDYFNLDEDGEVAEAETVPILPPHEGKPLYVDGQTRSGTHDYLAYSVNLFFRSKRGDDILSIQTDIKPANRLQPPSNAKAFLIQSENPALLSSPSEQDRLNDISDNDDKTLVRLTFDYNTHQELLRYSIPAYSSISTGDYENDPQTLFPDSSEVFAENIEIYFRGNPPQNVAGKAVSVTPHPSNPLLAIIETAPFPLSSQNGSGDPDETMTPHIDSGDTGNFSGGVINLGNERYIIHAVGSGDNPDIIVYKKQVSDALTSEIPSSDIDPDSLILPEIPESGYFLAVENMQDIPSWGSANPLGFVVQIGDNWGINREVYIDENESDGTQQRKLEKGRGIWSDENSGGVLIEKKEEEEAVLDADGNPQYDGTTGELITQSVHKGLYTITFHGIQLGHHPQYNQTGESVEWYRGIIRLYSNSAIVNGTAYKTRRTLNVIHIDNIGSSNDLVVIAEDPKFMTIGNDDKVKTGDQLSANFYPGYRVYLYTHSNVGLTEENTLPETQDVKYSIFGLRSEDTDYEYFSDIGLPALMYGQRIILPEQPEKPDGGLYATRPDFFGRSTYTFNTEYSHKPYGLLFYRSNDELLLNAIYEPSTIASIRASLKMLGGDDEEYFTNRWENFLYFEQLASDGDFKTYPPAGVSDDGFKFPNPDKESFFTWVNSILEKLGEPVITESPGEIPVGDPRILEFVKGALFNTFVPLTKLPIIFNYIEDDEDYHPKDEKQVIKDKNGHVLAPSDDDFKMAPMMKQIGSDPYETQFTDFKLDGTSDNFYFYGVKELGSQMQMGPFSRLLGPIQLVNTGAPKAPAIKSIMPNLSNPALGNDPSIGLRINSYPEVEHIKRIKLFRAQSKLQAQSVRTMSLAKDHSLSESEMTESVWNITDDFEDLNEIPYGEALYYRVVVERQVEYTDKNGELQTNYAPSKPSKIQASAIVERFNPPAPVLTYYSTPPNNGEVQQVTLAWDKTCYNGTYYVYKMNNQGNWNRIYKLQSNAETIYLDLATTDLGSETLAIKDSNGNPIYHHFKVVAENSSGMLSTEENILTLYTPDGWNNISELD